MGRSRSASRAAYLASPFRFCTVMHAYARAPPPTFLIDDWQRDECAWHRQQWIGFRKRNRGRWAYSPGLPGKRRPEAWPDPALLGASALPRVASRAQAESLQSPEFWQQLSERTLEVCDVLSVTDLAVIVDALLTADHRHTHLMKILSREFTEDMSKLTFVELAVVVNAYASFKCSSNSLLRAMADHVTNLLSGVSNGNPYLRSANDLHADPRSLVVVAKSFALLGYKSPELLSAINAEVEQTIERLNLADIADLLSAFVTLDFKFQASDAFWPMATAKVTGSRMPSLCKCFGALAPLGISDEAFREALVREILGGVRESDVRGGLPTAPLGSFAYQTTPASTDLASLPPMRLATPVLLQILPPNRSRGGHESTPSSASFLGAGAEAASDAYLGEGVVVIGDDVAPQEEAPPQRAPRQWYNAVARRPWDSLRSKFVPCNAEAAYGRNRRGALIAQALQGLNSLWQQPRASSEAALRDLEAELVEASWPVLREALPGVPAAQLHACAQLYATHSAHAASTTGQAAVREIVHESVRKFSNFQPEEVQLLQEACERAGCSDPFFERAQQRRFT